MTPAEFKATRESLGLSAQWIATAVRVDQRTVRRWEDGKLPLRGDVVDLLHQLDQQAAVDVARAVDRAGDQLGFADTATLSVPRVDADVNDDRGLPASYYRAVAARARRDLAGRLTLAYSPTQTEEATS